MLLGRLRSKVGRWVGGSFRFLQHFWLLFWMRTYVHIICDICALHRYSSTFSFSACFLFGGVVVAVCV